MNKAMNQLKRLLLTVILAVPAVGVVTGCASDKRVLAQAESAHGQIEPAVIEDPQLQRYVQQVGDRIVAAGYDRWEQGVYDDADEWMFQDIEFHLVNSPTVNAFTTGGKHVYLYTGLFEQANTEDGFAAVVGHEFGHIIGRHVQGGMDRQLAALGLAAGGAAVGALVDSEDRGRGAAIGGGAGLVGGQLGTLKWGRDDEIEADKIGFDYYVHAGYEPDEFREFFANMVDAGNDVGGFQEWLSSHPSLKSRVENADRSAAEWKAEHPDWQSYLRPTIAGSPQAFATLQQRAKQFEETAPQDTTLGQAQALLAAFPQCVDPDE